MVQRAVNCGMFWPVSPQLSPSVASEVHELVGINPHVSTWLGVMTVCARNDRLRIIDCLISISYHYHYHVQDGSVTEVKKSYGKIYQASVILTCPSCKHNVLDFNDVDCIRHWNYFMQKITMIIFLWPFLIFCSQFVWVFKVK